MSDGDIVFLALAVFLIAAAMLAFRVAEPDVETSQWVPTPQVDDDHTHEWLPPGRTIRPGDLVLVEIRSDGTTDFTTRHNRHTIWV